MKTIAITILTIALWASAAGASTGWYLLSPPWTLTWSAWIRVQVLGERPSEADILSAYYDATAPLSKWEEEDAFTSLQDCQYARVQKMSEALEVKLDAEKELEKKPDPTYGAMGLESMQKAWWAMYKSRCVATDDPRLGR